jgi:hypothetical protein
VAYELPDEVTLAKYMHLLQMVLLSIRNAPEREGQDLAYAVHNLPDLLMRWSDLREQSVMSALRRFEAQYPAWKGRFTGILERGAPEGWQLKWTKPQK